MKDDRFNAQIRIYKNFYTKYTKYYYYPSAPETTLAAYLYRHKPYMSDTYNPKINYYRHLKHKVIHPRVWDHEEYIATITPAGKRASYQQAWSKYLQDGKASPIVLPFTKIEKMKATRYKAPRMIQSRQMPFNVLYGVYLKSLEYSLFKHPFLGRNYAKGTNQSISNKIQGFLRKYKYVTEGDHKTFDSHVTREHKRHLHRFYLACFKHCPKLRKLARQTINNKCVSRNGDRYRVTGVMSGDVDTALGNCLINEMILREMLHQLGIDGELIVNGDDFLLFTNVPIDVEKARSILLTMNMECDMLESTDIVEKASFCSSHFVMRPDGMRTLMKNPEKMIDTFGMTHRIIVDRNEYLRDLAIAYAYLNHDNPIGYHISRAFHVHINRVVPMLQSLDQKFAHLLSLTKIDYISNGEITPSMITAFPKIHDYISDIYRLASRVKTRSTVPSQSIIVSHTNQTLDIGAEISI